MNKKQASVPPQVALLPEDRNLLGAMCHADRRPAAYQVSWLIREDAKRRGLLLDENKVVQPQA